MALRTVGERDAVETSQIVVSAIEFDLDEVSFEGETVGFVQRAGHVFVALEGARHDRAEECGQYLLWDLAATRLLERSRVRSHGLAA
ncbi:hypothetical protein ACFWN7_09185 [Agromyces sp. NPDC058484]|uniref:hypothetical protein n=1 Tax=Agromyces sp. NPDC058484 TaxID=3346524 RepID=UPI00364EC65B